MLCEIFWLQKEKNYLFKRVIALFRETFSVRNLKNIKVFHCFAIVFHTKHSSLLCIKKIFFVGKYTCMMYQKIVFLSVQKPFILNLDTFVLHSHVLHTCRNARVICFLSNEICACVFHPQILTSISITLIFSNKPSVIFLCYMLNPMAIIFIFTLLS